MAVVFNKPLIRHTQTDDSIATLNTSPSNENNISWQTVVNINKRKANGSNHSNSTRNSAEGLNRGSRVQESADIITLIVIF